MRAFKKTLAHFENLDKILTVGVSASIWIGVHKLQRHRPRKRFFYAESSTHLYVGLGKALARVAGLVEAGTPTLLSSAP